MNPVPRQPLTTRSDRTLTILTVARLVLDDGREGLGRVRNISATGLMLETPMLLARGDWVHVELRSQHMLSGHVVWTSEGRVGLRFAEAVDVAEVIACLPPPPRSLRRASQPRSPRVAAPCAIEVQLGGVRHEAELIDISQGGAKISLASATRRDERLILMVPGLPLKLALVRWTTGLETGLLFAEPLSFELLTDWLAVRQEGDAAG